MRQSPWKNQRRGGAQGGEKGVVYRRAETKSASLAGQMLWQWGIPDTPTLGFSEARAPALCESYVKQHIQQRLKELNGGNFPPKLSLLGTVQATVPRAPMLPLTGFSPFPLQVFLLLQLPQLKNPNNTLTKPKPLFSRG